MPDLESDNPHERALARFNAASKVYPQLMDFARRVMQDAEKEWSDAQDDLATYEQSPGIPLPEYRPENWTPPVTTWNNPKCSQCGSFDVTKITTKPAAGPTVVTLVCARCSRIVNTPAE